MQTVESLKNTSYLIRGIAIILALLPGVSQLLNIISIPPSISQLVIFISFFMSISSVISIICLSDKIRKMKSTVIVLISSTMIITGVTTSVYYYIFSTNHVINFEGKVLLKPITPSSDIENIIAPYDGDYIEALETSIMKFVLLDLIKREESETVMLMIALISFSELMLVGGIVLGAWKISGSATVNNDEDGQE